ncbi:hypothetical protein ACRRTK_015113 [Alexandromys fortis]
MRTFLQGGAKTGKGKSQLITDYFSFSPSSSAWVQATAHTSAQPCKLSLPVH